MPDPPPRARAAARWSGQADALGEDGSVRIGHYLRHAETMWLSLSCCGERGCQRDVPLGIPAAVALVGPHCAVRGLARRLRCSACGGRDARVMLCADPCGHAVNANGARPETRATLSPHRHR
jgi:hypothetical protein